MYRLKNSNGITLIALVITIIVMLILVAVTINMAVNGGLFGYAGNATSQTKAARDEEQDYADVETGLTTDELIAKYTTGDISTSEFLINGNTYQFVEGWTWEDWLNSDYNTLSKIWSAPKGAIEITINDVVYIPATDNTPSSEYCEPLEPLQKNHNYYLWNKD